MDETKILLDINTHEQQIKSLKHRMAAQEKLTDSINRLAINMDNMLKEQIRMGERIQVLEQEPAQHWQTLIRTIITACVGGLLGYIINFL